MMMATQEVKTKSLLDIYSAIAELSGEMVVAAESGDWAALDKLEAECLKHTRYVKAYQQNEPTYADKEYIAKKFGYISTILSNDKRVRDIKSPWMHRMETMIYSGRLT